MIKVGNLLKITKGSRFVGDMVELQLNHLLYKY